MRRIVCVLLQEHLGASKLKFASNHSSDGLLEGWAH